MRDLNINKRMKVSLLKTGLSVQKASELLDCKPLNLSRYLSGYRTPNNAFIYAFSKLTHTDVVYLLFGESAIKDRQQNYVDRMLMMKELKQLVSISHQFVAIYDFYMGKTNYKEPVCLKAFRREYNLSRRVTHELLTDMLCELGKI